MSEPLPPAEVCIECRSGTYEDIIEDYILHRKNGDQLRITNLYQKKCNQCGHLVLPWSSAERIDLEASK
jgi:YgiT-type zinc finger domain-containing protein